MVITFPVSHPSAVWVFIKSELSPPMVVGMVITFPFSFSLSSAECMVFIFQLSLSLAGWVVIILPLFLPSAA